MLLILRSATVKVIVPPVDVEPCQVPSMLGTGAGVGAGVAVGCGWRVAVGCGWRVAVGTGRRVAVGCGRSATSTGFGVVGTGGTVFVGACVVVGVDVGGACVTVGVVVGRVVACAVAVRAASVWRTSVA